MRKPQRPAGPGARLDEPATWMKYSHKMCRDCSAACCSLPVEVAAGDLVRMGLMAACELEGDLRPVARRLAKQGVVGHFHHRTGIFTLARMASGDCCFLDPRTRLCTIYQQRPDTCRNHPQIGPRTGYCAFTPKRLPGSASRPASPLSTVTAAPCSAPVGQAWPPPSPHTAG